jgi:hypothetical protein
MLNIAQLAQVKARDPYVYESLQQIVSAINALGRATGVDPSGSIAQPDPIGGISVLAANGIFDVAVTDNSAVHEELNPLSSWVRPGRTDLSGPMVEERFFGPQGGPQNDKFAGPVRGSDAGLKPGATLTNSGNPFDANRCGADQAGRAVVAGFGIAHADVMAVDHVGDQLLR